jgi:hypothetical protein
MFERLDRLTRRRVENRRRARTRAAWRIGFGVGCLIVVQPGIAAAAVTLLVSEGVGVAAEFHGGGHAAVYLSNVCSDDAVTVRLCRPGEDGVVLSTYSSFVPRGEYYWMAVPVSVYLYGLTAPADRPLYADPSVRWFLQQQYARRHLAHLFIDGTPAGGPAGPWAWPAMIGGVLERTVYAFRLDTTAEQDQRAIAAVTEIQRRRRFDLSYNNCSDFVRLVINSYFPGAVHRDVFNDFSFTTPKAIAKTFTSFGRGHLELGLTAAKYRQIEGPAPRSLPNRSLTEKAVTSKKYLALMLATNPYVPAVLGGLYGLTHPFSFERALDRSVKASPAESRPLPSDIRVSVSASASAAARPTTAVGAEWTRRDYQTATDRLVREAIDLHLFADERSVTRFAQSLESTSVPDTGPEGEPGLRVHLAGDDRFVGLTRSSIQLASSDPTLSYQLMLSVVVRALDRSGAHQPELDEIAADWALLQTLRHRLTESSRPAPLACLALGDCTPPSQLPAWRRWLRKVLR